MRYILKDSDPYTEVIFDTETNTNLFFLASSGFGIRSDTRDMAKRVVKYLNTSPETPDPRFGPIFMTGIINAYRKYWKAEEKKKRVLFNHPLFMMPREGIVQEESGDYVKIAWFYASITRIFEWFPKTVIIKEL